MSWQDLAVCASCGARVLFETLARTDRDVAHLHSRRRPVCERDRRDWGSCPAPAPILAMAARHRASDPNLAQ